MKQFAQRGFTLVELIMVVGIMGLLGTVATTGYYAAVRGMTDRGVRQDVISFLRAAQQRALSDDVPTAVYCYDELLRAEDTDGMNVESLSGVMVAVRMAGHISFIASGNILVDEFADWDKNYDIGGNSGALPMPFYRMIASGNGSLQNVSQSRSLVFPYVIENARWMSDPLLMASDYLEIVNGNETVLNADDKSFTLPANKSDFSGVEFKGFPPPFGFKVKSGNSTWKVGDAYGFEIGTLRLPAGYTFGKSAPTQIGTIKDVGSPILFDPATVSPASSEFSSSCNVEINAKRPSGRYESVGNAITANDLKDNQQK